MEAKESYDESEIVEGSSEEHNGDNNKEDEDGGSGKEEHEEFDNRTQKPAGGNLDKLYSSSSAQNDETQLIKHKKGGLSDSSKNTSGFGFKSKTGSAEKLKSKKMNGGGILSR